MKVATNPPVGMVDEYFQSDILVPYEWNNALDSLEVRGYKVQRVELRRRYDPAFPLGVNIKLFPDEDKEGGDSLGEADVVLHLEGEYRVAEEV